MTLTPLLCLQSRSHFQVSDSGPQGSFLCLQSMIFKKSWEVGLVWAYLPTLLTSLSPLPLLPVYRVAHFGTSALYPTSPNPEAHKQTSLPSQWSLCPLASPFPEVLCEACANHASQNRPGDLCQPGPLRSPDACSEASGKSCLFHRAKSKNKIKGPLLIFTALCKPPALPLLIPLEVGALHSVPSTVPPLSQPQRKSEP